MGINHFQEFSPSGVGPGFPGELDDLPQLGPLALFGKVVAVLVAGEAALRVEAQLIAASSIPVISAPESLPIWSARNGLPIAITLPFGLACGQAKAFIPRSLFS
ncbi:MAG: hypothetical protein P0Y56_16030 [Candidatus Andeanibacterium colombiense]|uniref:Uncharacterized protein n=1 Tax=Candidatus Andeanibacterium colombiense TaxID=3121345 RepID=A0AAJ6BPK9_9SPHN|nr:MAG: hypothetical protein P0Y56_16030 [Sphingomonadaceae bacterium]